MTSIMTSPSASGAPVCRSTRVARAGRDNQLSRHVTDMDDTLEQPKPSSNLNTSSTRDEDREQDSSGDEDGGLDWTKLPYVHLPLDKVVA
jgi:hypothetical protein